MGKLVEANEGSRRRKIECTLTGGPIHQVDRKRKRGYVLVLIFKIQKL
jgi:hypothetical protein